MPCRVILLTWVAGAKAAAAPINDARIAVFIVTIGQLSRMVRQERLMRRKRSLPSSTNAQTSRETLAKPSS